MILRTTLISEYNAQILYVLVHVFAMLSTITNPILYGWLNTNLKHLFRAMIPQIRNERADAELEREAELAHENELVTIGSPTRYIYLLIYLHSSPLAEITSGSSAFHTTKQ